MPEGFRDFQINGETLVKVKGPVGSDIADLTELGLASGPIRVMPKVVHQDIKIDDFGPETPAEVLVYVGEVAVYMTLIHFDNDALEECIRLAMGAEVFGELGRSGRPLGQFKQRFEEGCNWIGLNLLSPVLNLPWRFLTATLVSPLCEFPLGTECSEVSLTWRVIPYKAPPSAGSPEELKANGTVLWDRTLDVDEPDDEPDDELILVEV